MHSVSSTEALKTPFYLSVMPKRGDPYNVLNSFFPNLFLQWHRAAKRETKWHLNEQEQYNERVAHQSWLNCISNNQAITIEPPLITPTVHRKRPQYLCSQKD